MIIKISYRAVFAFIAITCFLLVGYALYLQLGPEKQQPCPLCILQRYAYIFVGLVAVIAALHNRGIRRYAWALTFFAGSGVGFAIWQLTKGESMRGCLADPIGEFVNGLPMSAWWDGQLFFATGGCADKYPPTLGLSVPTWSLICFALLMTVGIVMLLKKRRAG